MSDDLKRKLEQIAGLVGSTDQEALRSISLHVADVLSGGDEALQATARAELVKAAKAFTALLSLTFQSVAWNEEVLYDDPSFERIYERVRARTEGFRNVRPETVAQLLKEDPPSVLVFRCIAALSLDEISALLKDVKSIEFSKDDLRTLELSRTAGKTLAARWADVCRDLAAVLSEAIDGKLLELPESVDKALFKERKDKIDTRDGWANVRNLAETGVPYWQLLYQRYIGGFFRQAMDASSSIKGDILELALEGLFSTNGIPFYRTRPRERIPGWEQAPDFLLPGRDNATVALEAKVAEDGGTARDKAARIERFCNEARRKGVFPIVVIDGKGFHRINDVTAPILLNSRGEVYTLKTLPRIATLARVATLKPKN